MNLYTHNQKMDKHFGPMRFVFLCSFVFCLTLFLLDYLVVSDTQASNFNETEKTNHLENITIVNDNMDRCWGQYIYVYDLPGRFNEDLLKGCHSLMKWTDMCPYVSNSGLGHKISEKPNGKVMSEDSWYDTNQFTLEVIFHNIMKHYKCLTNDSSLASAIYVPYYAGLDVVQYLWDSNVSTRDASPKELVKWVAQQPQWKRKWGRDHFMAVGRISWDFRRKTDNESDWGTKFMFLPEATNMSFLPIESTQNPTQTQTQSQFSLLYDNEFSIPYPTYFHPSKDVEVFEWQKRMTRVKRPYLFSFVGAPRPNSNYSHFWYIRSEIIKQCQSSTSCKLLGKKYCHDPLSVMKVFQSSIFCLQPPGDSYTRRSTFDSILAGCIPVFFHPDSAYSQYLWHFPKNGSAYSVFIPEKDLVEEKGRPINETLSRIPMREVLALREQVVSLIPRIIYRHPNSRLRSLEDAFDIAVKGILERINKINVKDSVVGFGVNGDAQ
ncbi:xyloglucan galactosyltransferase MUR3-like [Gastrolobium bilobum]|uniref:xyloglucan galactosyltransferase MUR3-like n=1 Tax=Gastrolobium bilobum TaxID=150636 RepID=UPI002AB07860|nr:xyloglucan galactosyltransferase MUR3-like [Gastrolobium bilobum]